MTLSRARPSLFSCPGLRPGPSESAAEQREDRRSKLESCARRVSAGTNASLRGRGQQLRPGQLSRDKVGLGTAGLMAPGPELSSPWGGFLRVPSHSLRASCVRTVGPRGQTGPQRSLNSGAFKLGSEVPSGSRVTAVSGPRPPSLQQGSSSDNLRGDVLFGVGGDKRSFHSFRENSCKQLVLTSCPPRGGLPTKPLDSPCCPLLYAEPTTASWSPEGPSGSGVQGLHGAGPPRTECHRQLALRRAVTCWAASRWGWWRWGRNSQSQRAGRRRCSTCSRREPPHSSTRHAHRPAGSQRGSRNGGLGDNPAGIWAGPSRRHAWSLAATHRAPRSSVPPWVDGWR